MEASAQRDCEDASAHNLAAIGDLETKSPSWKGHIESGAKPGRDVSAGVGTARYRHRRCRGGKIRARRDGHHSQRLLVINKIDLALTSAPTST